MAKTAQPIVIRSARRRAALLVAMVVAFICLPEAALAQTGTPTVTMAQTPVFWYLLAAALALLVPVGLVLLGVSGLPPELAWRAGLGAVGALGIAGLAYWMFGFALQFGGVGLVYTDAGLRDLVWEWSPLPTDWGAGWGVAGLAGWFLAGGALSALTYALFLAHLPWVFTVALLPVMALRGRAPAPATFLLALLLGGVIYPVAGNWVQGGGWLSALGRNLNLGHGFVDVGGAGTVFLLAALFALAALVVWAPRRAPPSAALPPTYQPLLTVTGSLLLLAGLLGWLWANPLQVEALSSVALLRGSTGILLAAVGGAIAPLLYTWFVAGGADPTMTGRGLAAGAIAGLAAAPFMQLGPLLLVGVIAGATVPFLTYVADHLLGLDDATGVVVVAALPAMVGLLLAGVFADGAAGSGWQMTGVGAYLGVAGQGVSGLVTAAGFQRDFPGQLQAQVIGIVALSLWGFVTGLLVCAPLALLFHGLQRSATVDAGQEPLAPPLERQVQPFSE
jgi:Amt family ammonium transporter